VNYYRFWLLQRLTDHVTALTDGQQESVRALFVETGLDPMLDLRTTRRVIREGLLEVWE
jgi:hypothetical protein